jgi:ABC-2 type transport system permease protein
VLVVGLLFFMIKPFLRKLFVLLEVYYANMMEYRAEIFLWALSSSFPIILLGIWVEASKQADFGLSTQDFIRYFLAVFLTDQFTKVWVIWEFEEEIVTGSLSSKLLAPIDPAWRHVSRHLTEKITRIPVIIGLLWLFLSLYPEARWLPNPWRILGFLGLCLMAFTLAFLIQYTFCMLAFWLEKASAIEVFWNLLFIFFSGLIAPLSVFPPGLQAILKWTPFPYVINFPATFLVGVADHSGVKFLVMVAWIAIFWVVNRWLWREGTKKYSAMGA